MRNCRLGKEEVKSVEDTILEFKNGSRISVIKPKKKINNIIERMVSKNEL